MHGGSPAAASQRKTIQASDKEATLAPPSLIADDKDGVRTVAEDVCGLASRCSFTKG